MSNTQQPQPAGSEVTRADAAAELARIKQRQEQVIKDARVPGWIWWVIAAALVAIGAARDSHRAVVLAITIPLAVLVVAGAIIATLPEVRRRARINNATQPGGRGVAALFGLIVLVIVVTIATAVNLVSNHVAHPLTIGYAAGAAVVVIGGPALNRYLGKLMLAKAGQPTADEPRPSTPWRGLLDSDADPRSVEPVRSSNDGGAA